jgi:putative PEP-CTERM system TPR-repeat lipoprotein
MSHKASPKTLRGFKLKPLALAMGLTFSLSSWAAALPEAQQSFDKGEYSSAVIELKNLLQDEPKNAAARFLLGRTYLKQMDVLSAIKEFEKARQLGAPPEQWAVPLTRSYFLAGDTDNTIAQLDQLDLINSNQQAELLAIIGHAQLAKNQIIDGKETFQQALSIGDNAYARVGLARIAIFEKENDKAKSLLQEALSLNPDNLDALITNSQLLASQEKFEEAIKPLDHALTLNPLLQSARMMRSELYIRTNQLEKARNEANTLLQQNPNNGLAHFTLSRLQLDAQQYTQAQTSAEKALRSMPQHLMTHFVLGATHYAQQNFEQAQFYLEKFVAAQPDHLVATRLMGAIYLQLRDANSAIDLLANFVNRTDTKDAPLLNLLGRAYLQAGDYTSGTEMLNRALEIDPNIQNTRTQLAIGQIASGDINTAITQLENAIELPDATEQTSVMLILSYLNQQQHDKAFEAIDKAGKQYPNNAVFLNLKGMAHENQKDIDAAKLAYQQALKINKEFIPALLALAKIEINNQQFTTAQEYLDNALKISNNHLQSLLLMAQLEGLQNNAERMVKWMEKARDRNPEAYAPVNLLVNYYLQSANLDKARSEASRFFTAQGRNAGSLSIMARVSIAAGENDKARSYLEDIVAGNPQDITHRLQLAQLQINEKQYSDGLSLLDEVLALQPAHAAALSARTGTLIAQQHFDDAQQTIETFTDNYPDSFMGLRLQGDLLAAQQQTDEAVTVYEQAFKLTKTPYLAGRLTSLYQNAGKPQQATQTMETYLESAPADHQSRMALASLYQQTGKNAQAISHYETITSVADNVIVLNNLSWLYWLEKSDKALATAKKAHQLAPDAAAVIDTYGWIMLHQGDKSEALKLISQAISKSPANPDIRYHLAKALAMNGDKTQAKKEVDRLLRDYSNFEEEEAAKTLATELQ